MRNHTISAVIWQKVLNDIFEDFDIFVGNKVVIMAKINPVGTKS